MGQRPHHAQILNGMMRWSGVAQRLPGAVTDDFHVGLAVGHRLADHVEASVHSEDGEGVVKWDLAGQRQPGGKRGQALLGDAQVKGALGKNSVEVLGFTRVGDVCVQYYHILVCTSDFNQRLAEGGRDVNDLNHQGSLFRRYPGGSYTPRTCLASVEYSVW